jgi:hypothetical protein
MDRSKKVVTAYLNSAEKLFHNKTVIEDGAKKQVCNPCGPAKYTEVRDITVQDLDLIISSACCLIDPMLLQILPSTAINAALQTAIHTVNASQFQGKIDALTYDTLIKILTDKVQKKGK